MSLRPVVFLGHLVIAIGLLSSCKEKKSKKEAGSSAGEPRDAAVSIRGWKPHATTDWKIQRKDANPILHGISRRKFETLEGYVSRFDEHYPDGTSIREAFFDKFGNYDDYNQVDSEKWNPVYHKNLTEWRDQNPDAAAPWIALAEFEQHLAWAARGHGYADTVTEEGWKMFAEHYRKSEQLLRDAPESAHKDPQYFRSILSVGLAAGWPLEKVQEVFEAGQEADPLYIPLYEAMTNFLQPKWHGENLDDWHAWLEKALAHPKLSEEDRLVIYGSVVRTNIRGRYDELPGGPAAVYRMLGIDRARFMRGLAAYNKRFPDSTDWPCFYVYHACKAEDEEAIGEALGMMDGHYVPQAFGGKREFQRLLEEIERKFPALRSLVSESRGQ